MGIVVDVLISLWLRLNGTQHPTNNRCITSGTLYFVIPPFY